MKNVQIYVMEPNSRVVATKEEWLEYIAGLEDVLEAKEKFDSLIEVAKTLDGDWIEYSYFDMSESQIEKELTAEDSDIRCICAMRTDYIPTLMQIERGLTDDSWQVRTAFAMRTDYIPTLMQIERGLTDDDDDDYRYSNVGHRIREAFAERVDIVLTEAQIDRGLARGNWVFRENESEMRNRLERQNLKLAVKDIIPNQPKRRNEMTL